jgi:hypothetical protein
MVVRVLMKLCTFSKEGENCILTTQALAKINFSLGKKRMCHFFTSTLLL